MSFAKDAFAGRHVLVVGGTSGIGAGIARAFVAHGATARVTGATAAEVEQAGGLDASMLDVRDGAAVAALISGLARLDVLVNCAGVIRRGREHEPDVFADVIDINLNGTQRCCAAARALLATSKGCIVNTASMLSFFGGGLVPGYSASKGGVAQLTKSLAIAYAAEGIRVNALAPGFFASEMTETYPDGYLDLALQRVPAGRKGDPHELAATAVWLASDAAGYVTGQMIPVDGGLTIA